MHMPAVSNIHARPAPQARPGAARCVVCDAPSRGPRGATAPTDCYPTCEAVACRMVVSRRAEMGETGFRHYLQHQAREKQRQAAHVLERRASLEIEATENAEAWNALRTYARLPAEPVTEPLRLLLPSGPRKSRALAARRRERYREHLMTTALKAQALAPGETEPLAGNASSAPQSTSSMPGRLCALCGGGCCTRGLDHAYLSPATLRRFMDAQPELSVEQVVDAYLDRLSGATQAGSCVNHTRKGCSLPREMRSDICNRYACGSLSTLQAAEFGIASHPVLIVRRSQDQWHREEAGPANAINGAALLRETGVRHLPQRSIALAGGQQSIASDNGILHT